MEPESMVHALELIHKLLTPDGLLVDIHPPPEPPPILVRLGAAEHLVGWVRELDNYEEYAAADVALATAVQRRLFRWAERGTFTFTTYADTMTALRDHLAETWHDARIDEEVMGYGQDLLQTAVPDKEVILRETIQIARLLPRQS
jgi:hypothetical protein